MKSKVQKVYDKVVTLITDADLPENDSDTLCSELISYLENRLGDDFGFEDYYDDTESESY